jgi:hypothetical protein
VLYSAKQREISQQSRPAATEMALYAPRERREHGSDFDTQAMLNGVETVFALSKPYRA